MAQIYALKTDEIQEYEINHQETVRKLAGECMVVLENDGVLPLKDDMKRLALFGTGARHTVKGGTGSGDVNVRHVTSIEDGLSDAGFEIVTGKWLDKYDTILKYAQDTYLEMIQRIAKEQGISSVIAGFGNPFAEPEQPEIEEADIAEADAAIYVISRNSGEGKDRLAEKGDYFLSDRELDNIRFMAERYKNCIVLLNVGGVIDLSELREISGVQAVVLVGQTGNIGGYAVADVLPAGKWYRFIIRRRKEYWTNRRRNLQDLQRRGCFSRARVKW